MYVLFVARGYPSDKYRMNGLFEFDQAKALKENGQKVIFAAVDVRSIRRTRKWGFERRNIEGVEVYVMNIPCGRVSMKLRNRIKSWGLKRLYEFIEKKYGKPSIIHAHFISNGFVVAETLSKLNIPLVLTEHHSAMNQKPLDEYYKKMGLLTYSRMHKVIAVSEHLANNIKENFNVEVDVVPNVLDLKHFDCSIYNRNIIKEGFTFISVGGLHKIKRMDVLIKSFCTVFKDNRNVRLCIFGEGPERSKLQKIVDDYEMKEQVLLMGLVNRNVIAEQMSKSDCFVLVSESETFGVAYIEALAMGLPVIASKCGGPESFLNESNGIIVPVDNNLKLEKALTYMYENIQHYNMDNIAMEVRYKFSKETLTSNLTKIYQKLIDQERYKK